MARRAAMASPRRFVVRGWRSRGHLTNLSSSTMAAAIRVIETLDGCADAGLAPTQMREIRYDACSNLTHPRGWSRSCTTALRGSPCRIRTVRSCTTSAAPRSRTIRVAHRVCSPRNRGVPLARTAHSAGPDEVLQEAGERTRERTGERTGNGRGNGRGTRETNGRKTRPLAGCCGCDCGSAAVPVAWTRADAKTPRWRRRSGCPGGVGIDERMARSHESDMRNTPPGSDSDHAS